MKTSIKSFATGILAGMAFVALCATAQAQSYYSATITGWGLENDGNVAGQALAEPGSPAGYFTINNNPGTVSGNMEARANLATPVTLVNAGDTITFSFTYMFPTGNLASQAFRVAILNTNSGRPDFVAGSGGTLSGGPTAALWSDPTGNLQKWSGYVADFATGSGGNLICGRDVTQGNGKDWDSTSGDKYTMLGTQGDSHGTNANALVITATTTNEDVYHVKMAVQLVSPNFVNVNISMTNESGTYTNFASVYDDGTVNTTFAGLQCVSSTTFNAVGVFQNGSDGSGVGPFVYSNAVVTFSSIPNTGWTNVIIDDFNPAGIGPNHYNTGLLINVWTNWFGGAWVTNTWNSSIDAGGDNTAGSGSLQISNNWANGTQFFVYDHDGGSFPPIAGLNMTDFSCEVQFDSSSTTNTQDGNGNYIFGHLQIGTITSGSFSNILPGVNGYDIRGTNNAWVPINLPITAAVNLYEGGISNIAFKIDGGYYTPHLTSGTTTLRVDNVKFIARPGASNVYVYPKMAISPATVGMRFFTKGTAEYSRSMVTPTFGQIPPLSGIASWIGAPSYPVSYAMTFTNLPPLASSMQVNIFLIPVNAMPGTIASGILTNNTSIDVAATNNFGLLLNATGSNYVATVTFKTNGANLSLPQTNLVTGYGSTTVTGSLSGDGTWILSFLNNTQGTIQGPWGLAPQSFTIPNEVTQYFAGNIAIYIGIQPNSVGAIGKFVDFLNISTTNGDSSSTIWDDDFETDTAATLDSTKWATVGNNPISQFAAPVGSAYWIMWTTPPLGYDLEVNTGITGPAHNWIALGAYTPVPEAMENTNIWAVIPAGDWPTGATNVFFRTSSNPYYP